MKKSIILVFSLLLLLGVGCSKRSNEKPADEATELSNETTSTSETSVPETIEEEPKETEVAISGETGVLIHVMEGQEPYKFLLALDMAEKMAADHEVMVYFDHLAVNAVLKDAKDVKYSPFTPMREQLAKLQALGVKLRACSPCLQASWKKPEDVSPGVKMFEPSELGTLGGGNVMTFSY